MIRFPTRAVTALLLAVAPAAMLGGCAATLQPAAEANQVPGGGATASAAGVDFVTMTPDFPGYVDIESAVTPVKVQITNTGSTAIRIRYDDFKLVGADGTTYPALPLYDIDTTVSTPISPSIYGPIGRPGFLYRGFRVAPYYSGIYPGLPRFGGPFGYGRYGLGYYDAFGPGFARVQLPTREMYRNVLPEGVLDPGGMLQGWIYFKHVDNMRGDIAFDAQVTSIDGSTLGNVTIPYTYVRPGRGN